MQPETRFKLKVLNILRSTDNMWCVKIQQVAVRGVPDIVGCYQGRFFAWELKVGKNKVGKKSLQAYYIQQIKEAGGIADAVTPENFDAKLKELLCLKP